MAEEKNRRALAPLTLLLALWAVGCGDVTSATGDKGLLRFSLVTDFEVPESNLRDATIVARHRQRLDVGFTGRGRKEIDDPRRIRYAATGGDVETFGASEEQPPDLSILVAETGAVRLRALVDGEEIDGIDLQFEAPDSLELSVRVRGPWEDTFAPVASGQPTDVEEGSQVTLLPIPLGADGGRLAGDISTETSVDRPDAVVPGKSTIGVYEDGVWTARGNIEFYLIDPVDSVTFTVEDTVTGAIGRHQFRVADFVGP